MENGNSKTSGIYLHYYVMFSSSASKKVFSPITTRRNRNGQHGLDPELKGILPALWYCLHLPRNGWDTLSFPKPLIASGNWVPHSIRPIPSTIDFKMAKQHMVNYFPPTLVISEDLCYETACEFASDFNATLGCVRVSDLSNELLKKHWKEVTEMVQELPTQLSPLSVNPNILPESARSALPLTFMSNQFGATDRIFNNLLSLDFSRLGLLHHLISLRSRFNTMFELAQKGSQDPTEDLLSKTLQDQQERVRVPLVLTLPGTPGRLRVSGSSKEQEKELETEKSVIDMLAVHSAAASGGVWLHGGTLPTELFTELHKLECHGKLKVKDNRFVWRSMKRIGESLAEHLGSDGLILLKRASRVSVFSDFPIGLAILPGMEDPLCCILPISYKPLTPLMQTIQTQLPWSGEHYIGRGFKVIIAECLSPQDKIRKFSDGVWNMVREMFQSDERVQVVYSETQSIQALKNLLLLHSDADILVISAHGEYDEKKNFAGLKVGNETWLAAKKEFQVPPIVILSACHVAPRGLGAVTVNDLLFRLGARTVLGTLIPVDVYRNALLVIDLFVSILEALEGEGRFRSLDEAWHFTVARNALNEILESSKPLNEWAHRRAPHKQSPIDKFWLSKSLGRLRTGHIYSDTLQILREIAEEDGLREHLEAVSSSTGFFPESCFYVMTGAPETVILKDPFIERYMDQGLIR